VRQSLALLLLCLMVAPATGQETREVEIESDSLRARQVDGRTVFELLNPILTHEDSRLTARNGLDEGNGFVRFWGDVMLVEREDTIRAERVRYNKDTKIGVAEGDVRMTDGIVHLQAPYAVHYSDDDITEFDQGVQYADSNATLTAARARYFSNENEAEFVEDVLFEQEDTKVRADSLWHARTSEITRAWGRIVVREIAEDSTETIVLAEQLVRFAEQDSIIVEGDPRMVRIRPVEGDTLYMAARFLTLLDEDELQAKDSVLVSSSSWDVLGDSLKTGQSSGPGADGRVTRIEGGPVAWVEDTQITALDLRFVEGRSSASADSVFGLGDVFVASEDSLTSRVNQLKGQRLVASIQSDSLDFLTIEDQAEAVFFFESEDGGERVGFRGSGDGLEFRFSGGEVSKVGFYEGVEGTYYAAGILDQLPNLAGFIFTPERRPDRRQLLAFFWVEYLARTSGTNTP